MEWDVAEVRVKADNTLFVRFQDGLQLAICFYLVIGNTKRY